MTPKQGESENTGGKIIDISVNRRRRREQKVGAKIVTSFLKIAFLFKFLSFFFFFDFFLVVVLILKNLTPDIPRSIHFGSPRAMKKFSCLSYSSSSTILTLTVFL